MPALVIAGITVPVLEGSVKRVVRVGTEYRAYAGNLLTAYRAEKREWAGPTSLLLQAEADALRVATALGAHVACSGDIIGGTVTCSVEVGDETTTAVASTDGLGYMLTVALTIREV